VRMVQCVKLGLEAEGLDRPPFPNELGKRIFEQISKDAWKQWIGHSTMLINEYRLSAIDPKARKLLESHQDKFLFGEGSAPPPDYKDPNAAS